MLDALSTAILMENQTIVDQILARVPDVDFSVSYNDESVSLFETTIRYIGGMLSAYDLLKGPFSSLATNVCPSIVRKIERKLMVRVEYASRCTPCTGSNPCRHAQFRL